MVRVLQLGALVGVAADMLGLLPHHLREVAPGLEVVRARLAVDRLILGHLAVVHGVGEHGVDGETVADILAIAAAAVFTGGRKISQPVRPAQFGGWRAAPKSKASTYVLWP